MFSEREIIYLMETELDHFKKKSVTGVVEGGDISLKVDSQDNIHISYYDYTNQKLKYAFAPFSVVSPRTAWDIQTLSGAVSGRENSLVLDNNDGPGISYSDYTNDKYLYTYYDGSSWVTSVVTTGVIGSYPQNAAAMDNNGKIWIAYREELKDDLKFAVSKSAFPWPMMFPAIQNRRP